MSTPHPRLTWRTVLIDGPAKIVDVVTTLYAVVLIMAIIACYVSVALTVMGYLLGFPVP